MKTRILSVFVTLLLSFPCGAQVMEQFRPLYFIGGVPLQGPVDKTTTDLKFQMSLAIPLWKDIGDRDGMDLSFGYTQVSLWDFFDDSSPFKENVFIPGVYLNIPVRQNKILFGLEHRSNGRPMRGTSGDTFSRSVNYLLGEYDAFLSCGLVLKAQLRAGLGYYDEELTQEVFWRYLGYADFVVGYHRNKWALSLSTTPIFGPFDVNIEACASYDIGFCSLFAQYNRGYGEAICDWVRGYYPTPYIRFGILFGSIL